MIIHFEGCEASGKTSLIKYFKDYLTKLNIDVVTEHFPSDKTVFGNLARQLLYSDKNPNVNSNFLITLAAMGDQHLLSPSFSSYQKDHTNAYLTSRGLISTLVYSDLFNVQQDNLTNKLLPLIDYLPNPDFIIYLNPSTDEVIKRLTGRNQSKSIYDTTDLVNVIKAKYESVLDLLEHKYNILRIDDNNLFQKLDHYLNIIYQFTYEH